MDTERYMMGCCHLLAAAMHRLTGWDLGVVACETRDGPGVLHAFCIDADGNAWDVRGMQTLSDLLDEQEAMDGTDAWVVRLDGEAGLWALSRAGLLNPMADAMVVDAVEAAEAALGGAVGLVGDGWHPRDRQAVAAARDGSAPAPDLGRAAAVTVDARTRHGRGF